MGKLQITTAEIKTRILRVCHVKKTRIYTVSHVKNPYLTCVSCVLYFSTCRLQYTLATELPALVAIVIDQRQSHGPTRRMYNLAIHRFMCCRCRVTDSPLVANRNRE